MKYLYFSLLLAGYMMSCGSDTVSPDGNIDAIQQKFHGKYRIISSQSSEALDVNLDGVSSSNLMDEMEMLNTGNITESYILLTVNKSSSENPNQTNIFVQWWPEQFIRLGPGKIWDGNELIDYNPAVLVEYDIKGAFREFDISKDQKELLVMADNSEEGFLNRRPKSVIVKDNGQLEVTNLRRIYTVKGVKEVTVKTIYERYTMKT